MPTPPSKFIPDSKIPETPPFAPSVWLSPEQARANVEYATLVRADYYYRTAIGQHNRKVFDSKLTEFYTGRKQPAPVFAVSLAITIRDLPEAEAAALPFDQVAALYEI